MNFFRSKFSKEKRNDGAASSGAAGATASAVTNDENQSGNRLSIEYFQMQLVLDYLMRVKYEPSDNEELIAMCAEQISDDEKDIQMLSKFHQEYSPDRALWWYLQECFLYKILNYSLESQDIRNLFLFRKVLHDIKQNIKDHRCTTPLNVCRTQLISSTLLDKWISSVGQCIVVNSFLSATTKADVAYKFLRSHQIIKDDYVKVLIQIDADPRIPGSKPFVQIGSLPYASDKNEVLFMCGSVFVINNITWEDDGLYRVEMKLFTDNDSKSKLDFNEIKQKYGTGEIDLFTFANVLYDLDKLDEAEEYINRYRTQIPPNDETNLHCYNLLGSIALAKEDFETSLKYYKQVLELQSKALPKHGNPHIAESHENIGNVYWKQGN